MQGASEGCHPRPGKGIRPRATSNLARHARQGTTPSLEHSIPALTLADGPADQAPETNAYVITLVGMPLGDGPSPDLFNIFMDDLLVTINTQPRRCIASLFVDDVLLLSRTLMDMQHILNTAVTWAEKVKM